MKALFLSFFLLATMLVSAQEVVQYKQVDSTFLNMEVLTPPNYNADETYPAMVFFFGGGWKSGTIEQFRMQAEFFAEQGLVCFLVDYRVKNKNKTTPFVALQDAKSAMRFVRSNAKRFHINPNQIIGAGGSAGGHLAAATALCPGYNEVIDDLSVSCKPNALVLFNGVIDNGPGGYGYERVGSEYKNFSPLHNITKDAPPTLLLIGTKDKYIPVETYHYYKAVMKKVKVPCTLHVYEGAQHGFFNYSKSPEYYNSTLAQAWDFVKSLNYLEIKE